MTANENNNLLSQLASGLASGKISLSKEGGISINTDTKKRPQTRAEARKAAQQSESGETVKVEDTKNMVIGVYDVNFPDNPLGRGEGKMGSFVTLEETQMIARAHETQESQVILVDGKLSYALIDTTKETGKNVMLYRSFQKVDSLIDCDMLTVGYYAKS